MTTTTQQTGGTNGGAAPATALVARRAETMRAYLDKHRPRFAEAIPETMRRVLTPERIMRIVGGAISRTPGLADVTPQSMALAVLGAVQLGLEPGGPLGHAYLVPFRNKKTGTSECQLIVGYRGLLALARRTGDIRSIEARVVRAADSFAVAYGLEAELRHVPRWDGQGGEGARVVAAYAIVRLADGGVQVEVMTRGEIDAIRGRSRAGDSGPWDTDYPEMARKTVLRRALKYAPQSVELAAAMEADADSAYEPTPAPSSEGFDLPPGEAAPDAGPGGATGAAVREQIGRRVRTVRSTPDGGERPVEPKRTEPEPGGDKPEPVTTGCHFCGRQHADAVAPDASGNLVGRCPDAERAAAEE